jgi:hypothetical protein
MTINKKLLPVGGILLLFPSLLVWITWIKVFIFNDNKPYTEKVMLFINSLPPLLQSTALLNLVTVAFPIAAIILGIVALRGLYGFTKTLAIGAIVVGSVLFSLTMVAVF